VLILRGPDWPIQSLVFAPDAATLYAVHGNVGVHAWNLADRSGRELDIEGRSVFGEFAVHPGGRWAFGRRPRGERQPTDNDSWVLDLTNGRAKPSNFLGVVGQHIAISPDGSRVVTVGHSDYDKQRPAKVRSNRLYGWKMTATGPRYAWHLDAEDAQPWRVVFVGNETLLSEDWVPVGRDAAGGPRHEQRLCVRSAASGEPVRVMECPTRRIEQLLTSPNGNQFVVRRGTKMWVCATADWEAPPTAVPGTDAKVLDERAAAFHPSAPYLLLANNGPSVLVYDTTTWKQVRKWKWDAGTLRAVAVSADGSLAAAGGTHGAVVVWDLDL
jgi:WD40 repeat protein